MSMFDVQIACRNQLLLSAFFFYIVALFSKNKCANTVDNDNSQHNFKLTHKS